MFTIKYFSVDKCWNTEGDFTDVRGKNCHEYANKGDYESCGKYDTNCFKAKEMCCFCADLKKGGFGGRMGKYIEDFKKYNVREIFNKSNNLL